MLEDRAPDLRDRYGISWRITGVASRRLGWIADAEGLDSASLLARNVKSTPDLLPAGAPAPHSAVREWLRTAQAEVLFEATSLNVDNGQPGVDHIRAALEHGAHAITANKGPIVHAYRELRDLAARRGKRFLFESTVMDGVPVFSLFRDALPALHLRGFHGILNSTTNVILSGMEQGLTFDESIQKAQELGIAETDATHDTDGWDAAVKTAALINVLMDVPIRLGEIERGGIRGLSGEGVRSARRQGRPYKLVCRAKKTASGVMASVGPEQIPLTDPMAQIAGTSSYICFETDIFPGLAISEENPGVYATAYGMLADLVRAVGEAASAI